MDLVWSGGGLLDLKWTAEFAGLGHVGLNLNFLSPDYGSRVYLAALITDAELEPDAPLDHDLCPGLECGRCGVLCPPKAIPLEAPREQSVNDYRTLDQNGCSQAAMRISIRSLYSVLRKLMGADQAARSGPGARQPLLAGLLPRHQQQARRVRRLLRVHVRLPGRHQGHQEDHAHPLPPAGPAAAVGQAHPHRRAPPVELIGPPKDRDPEYIRDRDFDHLVHLGGAAS